MASVRSPTPSSIPRQSTDTLRASNSSTPKLRAASPGVAQRRNRAALRDYYNLQASRGPSSQLERPTNTGQALSTPTDLDNADFDPEAYVSHLLATSSLVTILKAQSSLITDVRTLDGERKALVYDNYSKLIKAVETIGKMRASIEEKDQPTMITKTLNPAIDYVTETATNLINERGGSFARGSDGEDEDEAKKKATVRWVLDTPRRLRSMKDAGQHGEAEEDWNEIKAVLEKWEGVKG
ncbi:hypothetical protein KEM55_001951, partial [Ascosphaera atra]